MKSKIQTFLSQHWIIVGLVVIADFVVGRFLHQLISTGCIQIKRAPGTTICGSDANTTVFLLAILILSFNLYVFHHVFKSLVQK